MYYVRDHKSVIVKGPFALVDVERMVRTRRLARHNQISTDRVTWQPAGEHPDTRDLFGGPKPPHHENPGIEPKVIDVEPEPPLLPPPQPSAGVSWGGVWLASACVAAIGVIGLLGWMTVRIVGQNSTVDCIQQRLCPSLATVQGLHPREGKKRCYAIVVSRNLAVAPLIAASFDALKIEAMHENNRAEWHSAHLVSADPVAGLCVLRADFGRDVKLIELPDSKSLPEKAASLRLVSPDADNSDAIVHGALVKVLNRNEPDERLQMDVDRESDDHPIGRTLVDSEGRLAGIEVDRLPTGDSLCVAAYEIRTKKKEAAKLPADHRLDRIDLPDRPELGSQFPPPGPDTAGEKPPMPTQAGKPVADGQSSSPAARTADAGDVGSKESRKRDGSISGAIRSMAKSAKGAVDGAVPLPELTTKERKDLGDTHRAEILKSYRPVRDEKIQAKIRKIVDSLAKAAGHSPKDFIVSVVQNPDNNAYAFVGGNIVVNEGFLDFAGHDDEMIHFALAHEMGHIVEAHTDLPFRRQKLTAEFDPGGMAAGAINGLLANSAYSQVQEEEADCFAVTVLRKLNVSTAGGVRYFKRLDQLSGGDAAGGAQDQESGDRSLGVLFGSHPDLEQRIETLINGCYE